jgi:hypothetical protein
MAGLGAPKPRRRAFAGRNTASQIALGASDPDEAMPFDRVYGRAHEGRDTRSQIVFGSGSGPAPPEARRAAHALVAANVFPVGTRVLYDCAKSGGALHATVTAVHREDPENLVYSVRTSTGRTEQCVASRMRPVDAATGAAVGNGPAERVPPASAVASGRYPQQLHRGESRQMLGCLTDRASSASNVSPTSAVTALKEGMKSLGADDGPRPNPVPTSLYDAQANFLANTEAARAERLRQSSSRICF